MYSRSGHVCIIVLWYYYSCSLHRPCTQANLDARAALAGEGQQQRRTRRSNGGEVDLVGVEEAVLRQRRRRQLGALLPAQLQNEYN